MAPLPLAHRREGEGPPVVCLHGLLGSGRNWVGVASALAAGFEVVLPDLRNHGASPWSDEVGYPAMADDVAGLLDALGLASARLVGHSMGGKVAMTLALTAPERVERLVVVDIAPVPYAHGFEGFIARHAGRRPSPPDPARRRRRGAGPCVPDPGCAPSCSRTSSSATAASPGA